MTKRRPAKICVRCQASSVIGWNWPEGFVCLTCVRHGVRRHGICPGCETDRALPGLDHNGQPICVDCACIPTSFRCSTCGAEDEQFFARTCLRCSLKRQLTGILDDGTGRVAVPLVPFFDATVAMTTPRRGLGWLNRGQVGQRLGDLATGVVPLTHVGVDTFGEGPGREHLRELLMAHGALPPADKYLLAFERYTQRRLATIDDPADRQTIRVYLRWRHHHELVARSDSGRLTARAQNSAQHHTNVAVRLLSWLRKRDVTLALCKQSDIDDWFATTSNADSARDFLRWAIRHRRCPNLDIPKGRRGPATTSSEKHRTEVLGRLLADDAIPLCYRVAGCLVVLLAQPVTKISTLRVADVEARDGVAFIRLGDEPIELPKTVGSLVATLVHDRPHMTTAANPASPWLFPGRCPNQHIVARQMSRQMTKLGISISDRQAALQRLVREVPAPIVARAMGMSSYTTARTAAGLGTDWAAYAALRSRQTSRSG